jgi:hypothetical protein
MVHPVSRMVHPVSRMVHPVSRMVHPVSRMVHPVSRMVHPVSRMGHPVSRMAYFPEKTGYLCRRLRLRGKDSQETALYALFLTHKMIPELVFYKREGPRTTRTARTFTLAALILPVSAFCLRKTVKRDGKEGEKSE